MIRVRYVLSLALLTASVCVTAQMPPWVGAGDNRIQAIEYRNNQVVRIRASPGYQVTVELAPDERVTSIALGDSSTWQVVANKAGNLLFVKPLQADVATNMTVITDVRTYNFDLVGVAEVSSDLPYAIRFTYPSLIGMGPSMPGSVQSGKVVGKYRLHGHGALRPGTIHDDGIRTYIDWPVNGPLPAVYSRDEDGRETLMNGNMRDNLFVIDGVFDRLIFRVDNHRARADRVVVENEE